MGVNPREKLEARDYFIRVLTLKHFILWQHFISYVEVIVIQLHLMHIYSTHEKSRSAP